MGGLLYKHDAMDTVFDLECEDNPAALLIRAVEYIELANIAIGRSEGIRDAQKLLSTLK